MASSSPVTNYGPHAKGATGVGSGMSDLETILAQQLRTAQLWMAETQRACALAGQNRQHYLDLQKENRLLIKQLDDAGLEPEVAKSSAGESGSTSVHAAWARPGEADHANAVTVVPPCKANSAPTPPNAHFAAVMPVDHQVHEGSTEELMVPHASHREVQTTRNRISKLKHDIQKQLNSDSHLGARHSDAHDTTQSEYSSPLGEWQDAPPESILNAGRSMTSRATRHGPAQAVFADANALKEKVRMQMSKPPYDVRTFYKDQGCCQQVARSSSFDNITLSVIALNAIWIAIDTDHNDADLLLDALPVFIVAENFFCLYFFMEWVFRFGAFASKTNCIQDAWFVFDTTLVTLMVGETWIMNLAVLVLGGGSSSAVGNASILRLFRLLRLSRMARMARLLRAMPELMVLIKGMVIAMRSVFFTLILLTGILYVFGIAFVQLMKDTEKGNVYFPNVAAAMNSLLLLGILPDEAEFIEEVGSEHWVFKVVILIYTILAALCVMNMLVGVLCEVVSVVSSVEKESLLVNYVKTTLRHMLNTSGIDADGDHLIAKNEFEKLLELPGAAKAIQEVGVDVIGLMDFTDFIFKDGRALTFPAFMDVILQLRGSNTATVKDVVDLRKLLVSEIEKMSITTSGVVAEAVENVSAQLQGDVKKAIQDATSSVSPVVSAGRPDWASLPQLYGTSPSLPSTLPSNPAQNSPLLPLTVSADKEGMSWATTAASRLNAAANELSAAAGQLSARRKPSNEQDDLMLDDEVISEPGVPGALRSKRD